MANTKSKKASGKLGKVLRAFNPRSFRGGMALFAFVFALTGGGYMLYRSFAATAPPWTMRNGYIVDNITATDGIKAKVYCISVSGDTIYGPVMNCLQWRYQYNSVYQIRNGLYSPMSHAFTPKSAWFNRGNQYIDNVCKNMDYFYTAQGYSAKTSFGKVTYGQVYRYANNRWEIKWAYRSEVSKVCTTTSDWMKATAR